MVQVRYTTGGDNGPPDPNLSDFVQAWNEEIRIAQDSSSPPSQEMFEEFEQRYGAKLPVVNGDFTPYWEDGAASTARETALNRAGAARLLQAETLWAMLDPAALSRPPISTKPGGRRCSGTSTPGAPPTASATRTAKTPGRSGPTSRPSPWKPIAAPGN